ncbi:BTAD domain-containing putative transcriptional regulator [Streptomyces sp. CT34]|uniref:AfsR/SARP family transcriptional regulator n=1 Tax=Streptomyces sp. CT34 TaxID=1553907 RepID=UPI000690A073|nr:BTAD domain-containing putative transcriptional regulator [Streptomyces sp. CT34]
MKFCLLGTMEVRDAHRVLDAGPRLRRLTLALLLLEANRPVGLDRIVSLLWDAGPPPTARNSVHGHISRLRRLLGGLEGVHLRTHGDAYELCVDPAEVDAHRFTALTRQAADASAAQDARTVTALREALGLWRGEMLAGIATDEVRAQYGAPWAEARLTAYEQCIDAELRLGRHNRLVPELTALVSDHPTRERFTAQLMIALHRSGRQAEAITVYRQTRQILAREFGLEPGDALRNLATAVLRADPGLARPAVRDDRAELLPTAVRPLVTPRQLPATAPHFTGREGALARLDSLLGGPETGVAAVSGPAGVGKTALALHWAHRVADEFPDGQLYADLRGCRAREALSPSTALARFLRALGAAPEWVPASLDEQAALYRSLVAGQRVLIILDNAHDTDQIRPLLPGSPGCAVVVTSRPHLAELVSLHGALPVKLRRFGEQTSLAMLARVAGAERITAEPDQAAALARRCAHLPSALRLAGGQLAACPDLTVGQLAARLDGARPSSGGESDRSAHPLRTAVDNSCAMLQPAARNALLRLRLLPAQDTTAQGAAALWDVTESEALPVLEQLRSWHLVECTSPGRFGVPRPLRAHLHRQAARQPDPAGDHAARGRLLEWYAGHADAAADLLYPGFLRMPSAAGCGAGARVRFDSPDAARAWLEAEADALLAAIVDTARRTPRCCAWRLTDALRGFFWLHGRHTDWHLAARTGLYAAQREGDARAEAVMRHGLGHALRQLGRHAEALEQLKEALRIHRRLSWVAGEAVTLGNLGMLLAEQGRVDEAVACHQRARTLHRRTGAQASESIALNNLGDARRLQGDTRAARHHHQAALRLAHESRCHQSLIQATIGLAAAHLRDGRIADALDGLHDAVTAAHTAGFLPLEARALTVLACAHHAQGTQPQARLYGRQALDTHHLLRVNSPTALGPARP